jgi:hypothetical protein
MSIKDNGGPAFPVVNGRADKGMTLRDWFAGQALIVTLKPNVEKGAGPEAAATDAYWVADAMLEARKR